MAWQNLDTAYTHDLYITHDTEDPLLQYLFILFCLSLLPLSFFHLKMESELSFSASGKWPERL